MEIFLMFEVQINRKKCLLLILIFNRFEYVYIKAKDTYFLLSVFTSINITEKNTHKRINFVLLNIYYKTIRLM